MDELKLAFETIIVGLLAIPWLLILLHLGFCIFGRKSLLTQAREFLTDGHQSFALIGPLILGLAYCGGTIIFPVADQYFNAQHYLPVYVSDDHAIRVETLTKMYFDSGHRFYDLGEEDYPGLPNAKETISTIKTFAPKADEISRDDYKKLEQAIHSIYNYQKYYDFNSEKGYEVLKPLESRIIVLRGAVLNGLFLLGALLLLFYVALVKVILRRWQRRIHRLSILLIAEIIVSGLYLGGLYYWRGDNWLAVLGVLNGLFVLGILLVLFVTLLEVILRRSKERIQGLVILLFLGLIVWALCSWGAWGVAQAEAEYDKHVVGIFYGSLTNAKIKKAIEPQSPALRMLGN